MHPFAVVQISLIQTTQQHLCGSNVGGNGYAVHIAQAQQILLGQAGGISLQRVAEEQHQIHLIAGNAGGDLLYTAQLTGEIAVHRQAGGLRKHPAGGTGGDNIIAGKDGTVSGTELQSQFFAGIVGKNCDRHRMLSPLLIFTMHQL